MPPAPAIVTQPEGREVELGEEAVFSVDADFGDMLNYQWQKDGEDIADATGPEYIILSVEQEHLGTYTVVLSNQLGENTTTSSEAVLSSIVSVQSQGNGSSVPFILDLEKNSHGRILHIRGYMHEAHSVTVHDMQGSVVAHFTGADGEVMYAAALAEDGVYLVSVRTVNLKETYRVLSF